MARREYARIGTDMPNEPSVRACTVEELFLYDHALYLRPEMSRCGVVPFRPAVWSELATNATEAKCRKWLKGLEKRRMVVVDERYSEVLLRTFVRHDGLLTQPNVVANMVGDFRVIASPKIRTAFLAELRRLWDLDLTAGARGGWCLAMGHYPQPKSERGHTWPTHIEPATLDRLRKSIGPGLAATMAEHIAAGSVEAFTERSGAGIPEPFTQTPYAGAIAVSTYSGPETYSERRAPEGSAAPAPTGGPAAPPTGPSGALAHPGVVLALLDRTGPYVATIRAQLAGHLDRLVADGQPEPVLEAALREWQTRDRAAPGLLPGLVQDELRRMAGPTTNGRVRPSTTDSAVAQSLRRAAELRAQESA